VTLELHRSVIFTQNFVLFCRGAVYLKIKSETYIAAVFYFQIDKCIPAGQICEYYKSIIDTDNYFLKQDRKFHCLFTQRDNFAVAKLHIR